jgi:hypothetical protein
MKTRPHSRLLILLLLSILLFSEAAVLLPMGGVEPAQAASPANVIFGLFRGIGALKRRNRVYREARATAGEINAYYDTLIAQTTETRRAAVAQIASGKDASGEPIDAGDYGMARAYVRLEATLEAERRAAIAMIEGEKNQARKDFEQALVKEIVNILVASPGGQRIIGQVRETLGGAREAAVAVQVALEGGKPIEALQEALVKKVGDFPLAQAAARELGSAVGHGVDHALGGALTKIEDGLNNLQDGLWEGIDLLDNLDAEVARHDQGEKQPVSLVEDNSLIGAIIPVGRDNPVADVVASAYAGATEIAGALGPGETRSTMRDRIRGALQGDRMKDIETIKTGTASGQTYCTSVGRGTYEVAAGALGQTPGTPVDPESAVYMVCYDIQSQMPVLARIMGGGMEEKEEEEESTEDQVPPPTTAEEGGEIPVGTYIGTPAIPPSMQAVQQDVVEFSIDENKITIIVEKDGTTHGEKILIFSYTASGENDEPVFCTSEWRITFDGNLQGTQGELRGVFFYHFVSGGPGTDDPQNQTATHETVYDVQISGNVMSGSLKEAETEIDDDELDAFSFEATKQ